MGAPTDDTPDTDTPPDTADHRPDVYREDGRWVFRASSLGSCDRRLVLAAMGEQGEPWPENIQRAMLEGVAAEPIILRAAGQRGWKMLDGLAVNQGVGKAATGTIDDTGQLCLDLVVGKNAIVRCHPDGVGRRWKKPRGEKGELGELRIVEAKALRDPPKTEPWMKGYGYDWQLSVEMAASGLPGLYLVGAKGDDGTVKGEDVAVHLVDRAPYTLVQIKQRVQKLVRAIEEAVDAGKLTTDCSKADYPCPFYRWHDGQAVHQKEEALWLGVEEEVAKKLRMLLQQYDGALFNIAVNEKVKKQIQEEVRQIMEQAGNWSAETATYKVPGVDKFTLVHRVSEAAAPYTVTPKPVDRVEIRAKKEK